MRPNQGQSVGLFSSGTFVGNSALHLTFEMIMYGLYVALQSPIKNTNMNFSFLAGNHYGDGISE